MLVLKMKLNNTTLLFKIKHKYGRNYVSYIQASSIILVTLLKPQRSEQFSLNCNTILVSLIPSSNYLQDRLPCIRLRVIRVSQVKTDFKIMAITANGLQSKIKMKSLSFKLFKVKTTLRIKCSCQTSRKDQQSQTSKEIQQTLNSRNRNWLQAIMRRALTKLNNFQLRLRSCRAKTRTILR